MAAADELDDLCAALARAMAGDPDAPDEVFADDVVFVDATAGDELEGLDEAREFWAEMAGRRARAEVTVVDATPEEATLAFVIRFRADAHQYAQHGEARASLRDGRVVHWHATWEESEEDLAAWDGD